ncbi:MAG: ATP-dependent 6-phosphofructokinase [bacterium]|nr:ATP-dependent 6-phosphofructokinase [bacterium]
MKIKRIGILTGGGDVPGLNTVIHDVTIRAHYENIEVVGIKRGWGGLIYMDPEGKGDDSQHMVNLDRDSVRRIDRTGGTVLRTSRTNPVNVHHNADLLKYRGIMLQEKTDLTDDVLKNLDRLGIDALVAIGGDDTLSFAAHLKNKGFPVVGVPKTMDNDVNGTEYCIGFSSAISRSLLMIDNLRTPMGSHERFGVIELFGRNAGFTALYAAYVSRGDRCVIPEYDFDADHLVSLLQQDKDKNPSNYAIALVSEGAKPIGGQILQTGKKDQYGHQKLGGIGDWTAAYIEERTGYQTIVQKLGYFMRSGSPDALDKLVAGFFANIAFDCIMNKNFGLLMSIVNGKYTTVPIEEVIAAKRIVDVKKFYHEERYRPRFKNMKGLPLFLK